jgi:sulfonate transport system ATP-binding protein
VASRLHRSVTAPRPAGEALAVDVAGARRAFGDHVVLDGLDLTVAPGEFVALLGHSGSGKSTLLRALAGLDDEVEGRVRVAPARSVVFQNPRLLPWRRVLANVVLGLPGNDAREQGLHALDEVGLAAQVRAWPVTLSGGEAQRVALARALVRAPDLLLLDEPFGALDALTRLKMYALLDALWRRHRPAVVHVTHDVDEALLLADRVLVLAGGRFVLDERVSLLRPRSRSDAAAAPLRARLLAALGVDDRVGGVGSAR